MQAIFGLLRRHDEPARFRSCIINSTPHARPPRSSGADRPHAGLSGQAGSRVRVLVRLQNSTGEALRRLVISGNAQPCAWTRGGHRFRGRRFRGKGPMLGRGIHHPSTALLDRFFGGAEQFLLPGPPVLGGGRWCEVEADLAPGDSGASLAFFICGRGVRGASTAQVYYSPIVQPARTVRRLKGSVGKWDRKARRVPVSVAWTVAAGFKLRGITWRLADLFRLRHDAASSFRRFGSIAPCWKELGKDELRQIAWSGRAPFQPLRPVACRYFRHHGASGKPASSRDMGPWRPFAPGGGQTTAPLSRRPGLRGGFFNGLDRQSLNFDPVPFRPQIPR